MYVQKLMQLLPYICIHFVFAIALCLLAYLALAKWLRPLNINWRAAVVVGATLTVYNWGGVLINMIEFHPAASDKKAESGGATSAKTPLEMKGEFLKAIDDLTSHPEMIKPEVKNQLFSQFADLFKTAEDKATYYANIAKVYQCQRYFLLDAQASEKAKMPIKSQNRAECEKSDGHFFNREYIVAPEVSTNNDKIIAVVAKKKMTDEEKKEYSAELIQKTLDQQNARIDAVKKIFE